MHDVLLAHGDAARREKEIHTIRIGGDHLRRAFHIIRHRADHRHLCAEFLQASRKEVEIAVVDLAGTQRLAGLQQFVARTGNGNAYAPMDTYRSITLTREYRNLRRMDALSPAHEQISLFDILARIAVVLERLRRKGNKDRIPLLTHILLPHDTVTALRNRAARHDADTLPRADCAGEKIARALLADHRQAHRVLCRGVRRARRRKGIAVERRTVKRRIVKRCVHILRRHAPHRLQQGNALRFRDGHCMSEQYLDCLFKFDILHGILLTFRTGKWDSGKPCIPCRARQSQGA